MGSNRRAEGQNAPSLLPHSGWHIALLLLAVASSSAASMAAPQPVPAPWTPLEVRRDTVRCWGRGHRVQGGLPGQVLSQAEVLLARPVSLSLGSARPLRWSQSRLSGDGHSVHCVATSQHHGKTLHLQSRLEYDGFWQVDLSASPGAYRRLSLEVPVASRHARYLHFVNETHYQEQNTLTLAERDGELWSSRFACMAWIGSERVGLAWCADSDAPFQLRRPDRALVVHREGGTTTLRITLIDHPVTLKTPLRWRFGLIATPVRPLPPHWREWRLAPGASANTHILWWNSWTGSHADLTPKDPASLARQAREAHACGQYLLPYVTLLTLSERASVYPRGGERWRRKPFSQLQDEGTPYWIMCPNTRWQQYLPDRLERLARDTGVNGLYFDFTFPYRCQAAHHPCGYDTATGERRGEFRVFATRRLLQTIYERVKAVRPDTRLMLHTSGALMYPYIGFGDMMLNGEQLRQPLTAANGRYMDVLPLASLRAEYRGQHAGLAPFIIPELATAAGLPNPKLTADAAPTNELLALALLHDVGVWPIYCHLEAMEAVRQAQRDFGIAQARFLPYWERAGPVRLSHPGLLASAWLKSGGTLTVVVNRGSQNAETRLHLRAAGGDGRLAGAWDALTGSPMPVETAGLALMVPARGFRLVRLTTRRESTPR
jgi:hypothetical protein